MLKRFIFRRQYNFLALLLILFFICGCIEQNTVAKDNSNNKNKTALRKDNRLDLIKNRGKLICGIDKQLPGFSYKESDGSYSGISVDLCRAIAVALFEDPSAVEFRDLVSEERFAAVSSGKVDILSRNTTWTLSRDTAEGLDFPPTNFYDGQGILVGQNSKIERLEDLNGKSICVGLNTTSEQNLALQMRKRQIYYNPMTFEENKQMYQTYELGNCDAATADRSELVANRVSFDLPSDHKILDEVISKEPLGPAIADGEPEWFDVVEWVSYATIKAEEIGVNSQNVDDFAQTKNPEIRRFLGMEENLGENIGLSPDFAQRIVRQIGNYGEIYDRNIGQPFNLERGDNNLVRNGGLIHSPPFR